MNKAVIVGIIAAIVFVGLVAGFTIGGNSNQESVLTESSDTEFTEETTRQGKNITIELSDGLNFGDSP